MTRISVILLYRDTPSTEEKLMLSLWGEADPSVETLIVSPGSTDSICKQEEGVRQWHITYPQRLGWGKARAIGGSYAKGQILVFWDASFSLRPDLLERMASLVESGVSLVLTHPAETRVEKLNNVWLSAITLNRMLGRADLRAASAYAGPCAMDRSVLNLVGSETLAIPPRVLVACVQAGMNIASKPVKGLLRVYADQAGDSGVIEDTLEALGCWIRYKGVRGGFTDYKRERNASKGLIRRNRS